jgi:PAS domain S-box-containing protein
MKNNVPVQSFFLHLDYFKSFLNSVPDAMVIVDQFGLIKLVNLQTSNMFGYSENELIGHNLEMLMPARFKRSHISQRESFVQSPESRRMGTGNNLYGLHKNGIEFPVDISLNHFETIEGMFVSAAIRLVSSEKQASQYARSLLEATIDPLVTINAEGRITDVNEAMVKATDQSRLQLVGADFKSYFIETEKANQVYKDVFEKGVVENFPLTIIDGVLTDVLLNGSIYKDDFGKVVGAVIVARDITQLKRIEKELTESKVTAELAKSLAEEAKIKAENATAIAEEAVKSKQQFLSNMSHEIRTPMNAIVGFTKVVLKTELSPKQIEYITAIKLSGDALIVLINDILDLAKVDAGKMTFEQIPFRLKLSISAMLHLFEAKISEKNLLLITEYDDRIPQVLLGDSVRLHQVVLNLVSNAVKFTHAGKITVCIKMLSEDEASVKIEFSVSDSGIGISEDNVTKIFDNFQQASSETSRLYGGTGLGLAIVKQLIEHQGGSVHVVSELGKGSTFSFVLPYLKTDVQTIHDEILDEVDVNAVQLKVLVVEDIVLNQLLMKTLLDDFGFDRDFAENGLVAIEKLQKNTYDIVLMDLQMPEMNGFEATKYIRNSMKSDVPIIALTADVTTMDLEKCKAVGMNDYLAKPLNERLLYKKIMALVKKPTITDLVAGLQQGAANERKERCTNLDYIKQITKSDEVLIAEMMHVYLDHIPVLMNIITESFEAKNWKSLYDAVHKMIPSFHLMGMSSDFEDMAKEIQDFASGPMPDDALLNSGMFDMIRELESVCSQACYELRFDLSEIEKDKNDN